MFSRRAVVADPERARARDPTGTKPGVLGTAVVLPKINGRRVGWGLNGASSTFEEIGPIEGTDVTDGIDDASKIGRKVPAGNTFAGSSDMASSKLRGRLS